MTPFKTTPEGLLLRVRLTPKASREAISGVMPDADGNGWLKVSVTAVPEDGKANKALVAFLAKRWKLPKTAFSVISGATDRNKTLRIEGDGRKILSAVEGSLS